MKFFYNFCLKADDEALDSDILAGVRKGYFSGFQRIKDKITINSDSDSVSYDYAIEWGKPMSWAVRSQDKTVLQDVAPAGDGKYYICSYRDAKLYKRILFSRLHTLLKVEYFDAATGLTTATLEPRKAKSGLCILYSTGDAAQPTVLYPMDENSDHRIRERVQRDFGNYTVSASTDDGIVRFLSDDQEKTLHVFIRCIQRELDAEQEISYVGEDTPLYDKISAKDFNVKRNLASSLDITKAAEFTFTPAADAALAVTPDGNSTEADAEAEAVAQAAAAAISMAIGAAPADDPPKGKTDAPESDRSASSDMAASDEPIPASSAPYEAQSAAQPDKMIMADGAQYSYYGELDDHGNRSGYGRTVTENGRTAYEGAYLNDKRSGVGSYYYKDGSLCYTGEWVENVRHGVGVGVSSHDGSIHVGRWAYNKPEGNGVRLTSDGDIKFVCRQLPDGATILTNYLPDGSLIVAKYDAKGKKLAEKTISPEDLFK